MKKRHNRVANFGFVYVTKTTVMAFQILDKFMYSFFLEFSMGRQKLSPNCKRVDTDDGIGVLVMLMNQFLLVSSNGLDV